MRDKTTIIKNPQNGDTKTFSYDQSYWSHDGFIETPSGIYERDSPGSIYTDQVRLIAKKLQDFMKPFSRDQTIIVLITS